MKWSALRDSGRNQINGLPPARHTEPRSIGSARHPQTSVNSVIAFVFLIKFYIMVTSFVLLALKISYWSFIFCDFQPPSSMKPWLPTTAFVFQNVEKMMKILKISEKPQEIYFYFEIPNWMHPYEEKPTMDVLVGSALRVPGGNPVDGLPPARHTGARGNPVPNRPSLFGTWTCLNMFIFDKPNMI